MNATKVWHAGHDEFMKMIKPSFLAVDEEEDMDAILARTHLIVITDSGVYHRLASTSKDPVNFMPWDPNEPKDLVIASQHHIFKEYKMNPHIHKYPPSYYEDLAWSQEFLRRLLHGERVPETITVVQRENTFSESSARQDLKALFSCYMVSYKETAGYICI